MKTYPPVRKLRTAETAPRPVRRAATPPLMTGVGLARPAFPVSPAAPGADRNWESLERNGVRKLGFYFALALLFVRFSLINEVVTFGLGFKPYLVVILGPLALVCALVSGGIVRWTRVRCALFFVFFMIWVLVDTPFSSWKGGTVQTLIPAFETEFSMLFIVSAVTLTWKEVQTVLNAIALCGFFDVVVSVIYGTIDGDRFSLAFGTLQNPNDYATHMILVTCFVALAGLNGSRLKRIATALIAAASLAEVFRTGSRGAFLAVIVIVLFVFFKASTGQKMGMITVVLGLLAVSFAVLPGSVVERYTTIFSTPNAISRIDARELEAIGSKAARTQLLMDSIGLTFRNPLFGVGPGQFAPSDADFSRLEGKKAKWQVAHNSYTEVASETGIPGFIFFCLALFGSIATLNSIYRRTRHEPALRPIANSAFYIMLSFVGFSICIFFASMEYRAYIPLLIGLTVAFRFAAERELSQLRLSPVPGR